METTSALERVQAEHAQGYPGRVIVVRRLTGEIVDPPGSGLESDESIAKAISIAVAVLSSFGLGGELRRMEVEYSAGRAVVHVEGSIVRVSIEG